jgi:DNA-binding winged helix-turn-helix (wHTH) protein/cytochrome c-type biogenesis protein CcmH/NrfG
MAESLSSSQQILRFGTFEVNPRSGELRKGGVRIKLHGQPFEVLAMLLERRGQVVTREELRLRLWPTDTFVNFDHGVNTAINKLREALGDSADNPRFVETLPRRGYRLLAGVEGQDRATAPEAVLPVGVTGRRAVAVLPFKLLTPNPEDDYLSVALADAVINRLGANGELLVRPTGAVACYAKRAIDPLTVARELNVQVIVEGSIQKFGQRLRLHAQVWNVAEGSTLLTVKHDSEMADLFEVQDKIAGAVARALCAAATTSSEAPAPAPTKYPLAFELFLRAVERLSRVNLWDTQTAIEMLEKAVKLDPGFVAAWARLAEAYMTMAVTFEPGVHWVKRGDRAIRRALKLDPRNAEAHCERGRALWTPAGNFRNRAALRALSTALRLSPGCRRAKTWQSVMFLHVGMLEEAKEGLLSVLNTDPEDALSLVFLGQIAMYRWDYDEAEEYHLRAFHVDPTNIWAHLFHPTIALYRGQLEEAAERIRVARQLLQDDPWLRSCEALLWAKRGEIGKAEELARRALRGGKPLLHTHHLFHTAAVVDVLLGNPARAIALLRKASGTGLPSYPVYREDPHFHSLREQPEFLSLMGKLKREWEAYRQEFGQH